MTSMKARENRLRRIAKRRGLRLVKSPRRDPLAFDYGRYWLVQEPPFADKWTLVAGDAVRGMTLDDIEGWLTGS